MKTVTIPESILLFTNLHYVHYLSLLWYSTTQSKDYLVFRFANINVVIPLSFLFLLLLPFLKNVVLKPFWGQNKAASTLVGEGNVLWSPRAGFLNSNTMGKVSMWPHRCLSPKGWGWYLCVTRVGRWFQEMQRQTVAWFGKSEPKQNKKGIHILKSLAVDRRDWLPEKIDQIST